MDAATLAPTAAAVMSTAPNDPFIDFMKWAVAILLLILVGAKPLLSYIRQSSEVKADNSKDNAEGVLYTHLAEQVREYRALADEAIDERNKLLIRVTEMEYRMEQFAEMQARFVSIQRRIEKKDETISMLIAQGNEERVKFMQILEAKDQRYATLEASHRELEARVSRDETRLGVICPLQREGEGFASAVNT